MLKDVKAIAYLKKSLYLCISNEGKSVHHNAPNSTAAASTITNKTAALPRAGGSLNIHRSGVIAYKSVRSLTGEEHHYPVKNCRVSMSRSAKQIARAGTNWYAHFLGVQ